ncbi:BRO1-domain-containing protein [Fomitiporia mediterranea MF3/22]|uniref:BRO1-domain-containing protein n=1 Tax=Fomitiporia mediterranea (strain MF3/22) TaxID=694068 RepID=UPI0004409BED|nr:BRO1-domain-containing protein [Fomitiporia mediterranea MF3/22]EJD06562.1 BRO1-domain-containing protein [Fomitiporia mediterranea MF3/22]
MSNQLSIPFKKTSQIPIRQAVRSYIQENLPDTHPEAFKWDIERWEQLRRDATSEKVHASHTQAIIKYCAQLAFILTKLPVDISLTFPYSVALRPSERWIEISNIAYERVAMLFNLAALYSQLASGEDRSHAEGIKRASAYYQNAAGTLSYLITFALPALAQSLDGNARIDELSEPFLRSLEFLMLAQAQECAWQRAVIDHYKNAIVAKLAAKVASYYRLSSSTIRESRASEAFPSEWLAHIDTKHHHFESAAQYRKSVDDLESNNYGHELSRLIEAKSIAKKGYEIARRAYVSRPVVDDIKSLLDTLEKSIVRAERDNDLIYHQVVPPISAVPSIQDISMVQSAVPPGLQDPKSALGNEDVIFGELVGWGAKVAVEIYRDRVQNWLQEEVFNRVMELDDFADHMLQELSLPASLEALDKPVGLPPSLLRKAEEVRLEDGPARIDGSIENAEHLSERCREILDEAMDILDQEASEDEGVRKNVTREGRRWDRLPSYQANIGLTEKEKRYRQMLDQAAEADDTVRSKWEQWEEPITRLTWDENDLERWVPSSTSFPENRRKDAANAHTQTHARALRAHLETLDDLRSSRAQLVQRARRLADGDDIQPRIMREAAAFERWREVEPVMFENTLDQEMNKYERFKDGVEESADKQVELSDLIRSRHEQFIRSRLDDPSIKEREHALQSLDLAYHKYREIIRNLEEGLKFYNDLLIILTRFREACKEWVRLRRDEMRTLSLNLDGLRIDEDNLPTPKASSGSLHPVEKSHSKGKAPDIHLPPPDSDEWEATPMPAQSSVYNAAAARR